MGRKLDENSIARAVFISHCCSDENHTRVTYVMDHLANHGIRATVDPLDPGDLTALRLESEIRASTHFVLIATEECLKSRWVRIEVQLAKFALEYDAIGFIPVRVSGAALFEDLRDITYISLNSPNDLPSIAEQIVAAIDATQPKARLRVNQTESELAKNRGRKSERQHARTQDLLHLHEAVRHYSEALVHQSSNHNAWANRAWVLWKLREPNRAWSNIQFAKILAPESNHVRDVLERMEAGRYSIQ